MSRLRLLLFVSAAVLAGALTGALHDGVRPLARPTSADSLAGVVARVVGGDSTRLGSVIWLSAPSLGWGSVEPFAAYRPGWGRWKGSGRFVKIAARTYLGPRWWRPVIIVIAQRYVAHPGVIKHELAHALLGTPTHPPALFSRIEAYAGR